MTSLEEEEKRLNGVKNRKFRNIEDERIGSFDLTDNIHFIRSHDIMKM